MPWGATTLGRVNRIAFANSPYTAVEGEIIECDTTAGDIVVNAPAIGTGGKRFTVKRLPGETNIVTVSAASIESKITGTLGTFTLLTGDTETLTFYADAVDGAWRIYALANPAVYAESFQGTPDATLSGTPTPILWTFVPLFTGQTPVLTSYAAGTFTFNLDLPVDIKLAVRWEFAIGQNEDASGIVADVFSGAGFNLFIPVEFPFAHSRAGSYFASQSTDGTVDANVGDTYRFDASEDPGQAGSTNLDEALLIFGVG